MTWDPQVPKGNESVSSNRSRFEDNWSFIESSMENDHFWDTSGKEGRHNYAQMPKQESGGSPSNPTIAANMHGVYYVKDKTASDAPDLQMAEPHYISNDGTRNQIQQLGFRAMGHFTVNLSTFAITEKYIHNCSIARSGVGLYTVTFDVQLPTANYIVMGSAMRNSGSALNLGIQSAASKATSITATSVVLAITSSDSGSLQDPLVCMFAICGG